MFLKKQKNHARFLEVTTITKETGFLSENLHYARLDVNVKFTTPCDVTLLSFSVIYFFLRTSEMRPYRRLTH